MTVLEHFKGLLFSLLFDVCAEENTTAGRVFERGCPEGTLKKWDDGVAKIHMFIGQEYNMSPSEVVAVHEEVMVDVYCDIDMKLLEITCYAACDAKEAGKDFESMFGKAVA